MERIQKIIKARAANKDLIAIVIILVLTVQMTAISSANSPLYAYNQYSDLQIYTVVQRAIRNGQVLYKDVFDHKGPALFLIGTLLYYNKITIWILDIVTIQVQAVYIYKQIRLFGNIWKSITGTIIGLALITAIQSDWGQPEQIIVALMVVSGYMMLKNKNSKVDWLIYGFIVAFVFYSKISLVIFWAPMFFYLLYKQIKSKKAFINLAYAATQFIGVTIAILIYFVYNNAVYDFIHSYFTLNIKYQENTSSAVQTIASLIIYAIILIEYALIVRKQSIESKIYLLCATAAIFGEITLSNRIYPYYLLCAIPCIVPVFTGKEKIQKNGQIILCAVCVGLLWLNCYNTAKQSEAFLGQKSTDVRWQFYQDIKQEVNSGSFYGVQTIYYIGDNLAEYLPYNTVKYQTYCNMSYDCNPDMYEYTLNGIKNKSIEYIAFVVDKESGSMLQQTACMLDQNDAILKETIKGLHENYELKFRYSSDQGLDIDDAMELQVFKVKEQ